LNPTSSGTPAVWPPVPALALALALVLVLVLAGCAQGPGSATAPPPPPRPTSSPAAARTPAPALAPALVPARMPAAPLEPARAAAPDLGAIPRNPRYVKLDAPPAPRSAAELRAQFALRLVAAHPDSSYTSRAPDRLLAIPVLEVELNADGSVRDIKVLRKPTTGAAATELAIAAVRRAAPYGNVSKLPRPWRVVETFLFDDNLRFKPRTLDQD
jgi:hypothetical protein